MNKYQVTYAPSFNKNAFQEIAPNFKPIAKGRIMKRPTSVSSNSSIGSSILSIEDDLKRVESESSLDDQSGTPVRTKTISRTSLASYKSNGSNDSGASFNSGNFSNSEELNSRSVKLQKRMAVAALELHEKVFGEECSFVDDAKIGYWNFSQSPIKIKKQECSNQVKDLVNQWNNQLHMRGVRVLKTVQTPEQRKSEIQKPIIPEVSDPQETGSKLTPKTSVPTPKTRTKVPKSPKQTKPSLSRQSSTSSHKIENINSSVNIKMIEKVPFLRKKCCSAETTTSCSSLESSPERPLTTRVPQRISRKGAFKKNSLPMIRVKGVLENQLEAEFVARKREIGKSVHDLAGLFVNN